MSREEIEAGNKTVYVFALAILFVFLVLAALYESWKSTICRHVQPAGRRLRASVFAYLMNQQK